MRRLILGSITLLSCTQLASANTINRVVTFGDSLSDSGNVNDLTWGFAPGSAYYEGRFSNGPVWAEQLANRLGLSAPTPSRFNGYDYAHGGVHSGPGDTWLFWPLFSAPNVGAQINQYLTREPARSDDLYTVWSGANDFFDGETDINLVANNMRDHVLALANAGAENISVSNLPLLGDTPRFRNTPDRATWNARTQAYNIALASRIEAIRPTLSANIYFVDVASMFADVLSNPSNYGLTNVTEPAYNGDTTVPNADDYLFFDEIHPTRRGHDFLSRNAFEIITLRTLAGSFGNADWHNMYSWNPDAIPDMYSNVQLDSTVQRIVSLNNSGIARKMTVGSTVDLRFNQSSLNVSERVDVMPGGTLSGTGTITTPTLSIDGKLSPGVNGIGQFTIIGDADINGTLTIDLDQSQADQIYVSNHLGLTGTIEVNRVNQFIPIPGDIYNIAIFGSMSGIPSIFNATGFAGLSFDDTTTNTTLSLLASGIVGDANLDSFVDFTDLLTLAQNYGQFVDQMWLTGDFNRDNMVDFNDLLGLAQNYQGASFDSDWNRALTSVPEPTFVAMLAFIPILSARRSRRNRDF